MSETQERKRDPFQTIEAKFPGRCKRCGLGFERGTMIRWARGRGRTYHLASKCPANADALAASMAGDTLHEDTMGVSPDALEARYSEPEGWDDDE